MAGKRVAPMSVKIQMKAGKPVKVYSPKPKRKKVGFTNRLAIYILLFLAAGLVGGFLLAWRSITYGYVGALVCFTAALTPIGTATSVVLSFIVQKSKAENTGANGEGIVYATAMANNFVEDESAEDEEGIDSPAI